MPHALIQLVSEQTMPNVLAALALRPEMLILLHTRRTEAHASWIAHALQLGGLNITPRMHELAGTPDIMETARVVRNACDLAVKEHCTPVVNITCGTKLMSIGAFAAAQTAGCAALYVDSDQRRILSTNPRVPLPAILQDSTQALDNAAQHLTVDVLAAAHGCEHVSAGEDPAPYLALANHLSQHQAHENACHQAFKDLKTRGLPRELLATAETDMRSVTPPEVAKLAVACGLLEERGAGLFISLPDRATLEAANTMPDSIEREVIYAAARPLQLAQSILSGGWLEIKVWDAAKRSGLFRHLRWSVRFGSERDHIEEDLVAVHGLNLAVISCKRGGKGDRLNRALEEFLSGSNRIGGSFASKFFCVANTIHDDTFAILKAEAARNRIKLIDRAWRITPASFISTSPHA